MYFSYLRQQQNAQCDIYNFAIKILQL